MRPLAVFALALAVGGCTTTRKCRQNTALVKIHTPGGVDTLTVSITFDGVTRSNDYTPRHEVETLEIDFGTQYAAGTMVTLDVVAKKSGVVVARDRESPSLEAGCSVIDIDLSTAVDGGIPDGPVPDGALGIGERCGPGDVCANGTCVDGYCCESACSGQCQACDVDPGHCMPVTGAPHGSRAACTGDTSGACAGSCDGTNTDACNYPTAECAAGSCAGGIATLPKLCKSGTCPSAAADTQTCHLGCDGDSCLGVKQVAAARTFACAVLTNGTVKCWGGNSEAGIGQGAGDNTPAYSTPTTVPAFQGDAVELAGSQTGMCARLMDGSVKCWGDGNGTPTAIGGISGATFLSGSSSTHYCAIVAGGELRCWGYNTSGELGNGGTSASLVTTPVAVCAPGSTNPSCAHATGATWVWSGDNYTCAVLSKNVYCFGDNSQGQLGLTPDANPHLFPSPVPGLMADSLTAGNSTTCAVSGGLARCWGNGGDRLGDNNLSGMPQPSPAPACTTADCSMLLMSVTGVTTFDESVCALAGGPTGTEVRCWGANSTAQLGDGSTPTAKTGQSYAASVAVASGAVQVVAGGQSNYAIVVDRADRYLVDWGADDSGELGDGRMSSVPSPAPVQPKW